MNGFAGVSASLLFLGIIIGIAWIILPFAMIGTKPLLRELIQEVKKMNTLLRERQDAKISER